VVSAAVRHQDWRTSADSKQQIHSPRPFFMTMLKNRRRLVVSRRFVRDFGARLKRRASASINPLAPTNYFQRDRSSDWSPKSTSWFWPRCSTSISGSSVRDTSVDSANYAMPRYSDS